MGKKTSQLSDRQIAFVKRQKLFFVATAAQTGSINLSPKGLDSLRVIDGQKVVWLNLTGSGNETAAHLLQNPRITLMFCAFEGPPQILRVYGRAKCYGPATPQFENHYALFEEHVGARQIVEVEVDLVQSSCGFGVPLMDFKAERTELTDWANKLGQSEIEAYQKKKNSRSLDGLKTDIEDAS